MTHYEALEIPENASEAEIRGAYRRLVLLTHPDRTPDPAAHARYLDINTAYETLGTPERRIIYDGTLDRRTLNPPPAAPPRRTHGSTPITARSQAFNPSLYLKYAPLGRLVCKCLLVFGLLLGIDRLWVLTLPHEPVLASAYFSSKYGKHYVTKTPHASFRGQGFRTGDVLLLRRTAIFHQVIEITVLPSQRSALEMASNTYTATGFLYGGGVIFPVTMFLTALVGAWPGRVGRRQVDCAVTGGLLALIIGWLLMSF